MNQFDFFKKFPTENDAIDFIVKTKYKDGYVCPKCGCVHHKIYHQKYNRRYLYCNNCQSEFSALTGTIFEHTHLDIRMWLFAINLVLIARKGISGLQLQRELGMKSYKGAFRMLKLIRAAMGTETHKDAFEAIVEIDETYVGGKPRKENTHKGKSTKKSKRGRGTSKTPVVGVLERNSGRIHAVIAMPNKEGKKLSGKQLLSILDEVCKKNTTVMTDQLSSYGILEGKTEKNFTRIKVDHSMTYSLGDGKHTHGIESCWAILNRGVYGIYHHVSVKHLQEYVDEFCYRLNHRDIESAWMHLFGLGIQGLVS